MKWQEFFRFDWKRIFLTGFLLILFLAINKTVLEAFFMIISYIIVVCGLTFFVTQGGFPENSINSLKKYIAFVSLLTAFIFYYLMNRHNFIFTFTLYGLISFLISYPISWILKPMFNKMNNILNVKRSKIFWIIITILILSIFFILVFQLI